MFLMRVGIEGQGVPSVNVGRSPSYDTLGRSQVLKEVTRGLSGLKLDKRRAGALERALAAAAEQKVKAGILIGRSRTSNEASVGGELNPNQRTHWSHRARGYSKGAGGLRAKTRSESETYKAQRGAAIWVPVERTRPEEPADIARARYKTIMERVHAAMQSGQRAAGNAVRLDEAEGKTYSSSSRRSRKVELAKGDTFTHFGRRYVRGYFGWGGLRSIAGLEADSVELSFTGKMLEDFRVTAKARYEFDEKAGVGSMTVRVGFGFATRRSLDVYMNHHEGRGRNPQRQITRVSPASQQGIGKLMERSLAHAAVSTSLSPELQDESRHSARGASGRYVSVPGEEI